MGWYFRKAFCSGRTNKMTNQRFFSISMSSIKYIPSALTTASTNQPIILFNKFCTFIPNTLWSDIIMRQRWITYLNVVRIEVKKGLESLNVIGIAGGSFMSSFVEVAASVHLFYLSMLSRIFKFRFSTSTMASMLKYFVVYFAWYQSSDTLRNQAAIFHLIFVLPSRFPSSSQLCKLCMQHAGCVDALDYLLDVSDCLRNDFFVWNIHEIFS